MERKPFAITGRRSESHPGSTGTTNCSGSITTWQNFFAAKANLMTRTLISNKPGHIPKIMHTTWLMQPSRRLTFIIDNEGSRMELPRFCARSKFLGSWGLCGMWGSAKISSKKSNRRQNVRPLPAKPVLPVRSYTSSSSLPLFIHPS